MRKWVSVILITLLLAGGAVLCAVRWQAWFGMPPEHPWTGDTISYAMPAFTHDSTPESLDLIVLGDIHNNLTREDYDTLAARIPQADAVVQTGDWLDRGQYYYYQLLMREWTNSGLYGLPVIACPGNHEYTKGIGKTISPIWVNTFLSRADSCGQIQRLDGVPGASYYIDLPSVRLIAIDTNPLVRVVHLTRTLTWLRNAMYTAGDRYVIVIMHHPVLSPAKGRANTLIYTSFRHALGQADLVLAGHDHSYMRRAPFVVLNTAGKRKTQRMRFHPEKTDTVPAYGVISLSQPASAEQVPPMAFRVFRLKDGVLIDSLYVKHD